MKNKNPSKPQGIFKPQIVNYRSASSLSNKELKIKVNGRVPGVTFRRTVSFYAGKHNINGCVLNRADGSADIVAQGERSALLDLLRWVAENPGFSDVKSLQYEWGTPSQEFNDFSIIREDSFVKDQMKSVINLGRAMLAGKKLRVPLHTAIIPDGNRRWARSKGLASHFGHYTSVSFNQMQALFQEAERRGVKHLTLWGFSTENWKRHPAEVNAIFDLLLSIIKQFRSEAVTREYRFHHIGRKDRLPKELIDAIKELEEDTKRYNKFHVHVCLDYGGTDEIIRAVNKAIEDNAGKIDEESFKKYLDSSDVPPIDLIIRTSGEQRLSGFMPLQAAYAELYFTTVPFPDFTAKEFRKALDEYGKRERRFGGDKK